MSNIRIVSITGMYDGLREEKNECVSLRVRDINETGEIEVPNLRERKVIRLLIDAECKEQDELITALNQLYYENPDLELHINIEHDGFFEQAKEIASKVQYKNKNITLWHESELKNRDYLNLKDLPCPVLLPMQYGMWFSDLEELDKQNVFFYRSDVEARDGSLPFSKTPKTLISTKSQLSIAEWGGSDFYSIDDMQRFRKAISQILSTDLRYAGVSGLSDDQKAMVVMKFLVDNYEYDGELVDKSNPNAIYEGKDTIKNKKGVCSGLAEVYTMLLNNPIIQVDARKINGLYDGANLESGHSWCAVKLQDDKTHALYWYYMDPSGNVESKDYYRFSFMGPRRVMQRKVLDGPNPDYDQSNFIGFTQKTITSRLEEALERMEKAKNGVQQIKIIRSYDEIAKEQTGGRKL